MRDDGRSAEDRLKELVQQHPRWGRRVLARALCEEGFDVTDKWVRTRHKKLRDARTDKPGDEVKKEFSDNTATITTKSLNIQTLDQALKASKVDLTIWEVDRYVINSWEVTTAKTAIPMTLTNYQVKVWLRRREAAPVHLAIKNVLDELRTYKPTYPDTPKTQTGHLAEICVFDHHFGKLAWKPETGTDYDLKIAEKLFVDAVGVLLARASVFGVEKILFPLGNDFLHVDGPENATVAGTPQDVDSRYPKIFTRAKMAVIQAIDMCLSIAPVQIVWIGSNHDMTASYALAQVIAAYYHGCDKVQVDAGPNPRKFVRHGTCLIGYTHGNDEKHADLPLLMATTVPDDWAKTTHREWHIGHFHKKKETKYNIGDTWNGVSVRVLDSLSGTDAWHHRKGYCNGIRAAEAFMWHPVTGYAGHINVNAKELMAA